MTTTTVQHRIQPAIAAFEAVDRRLHEFAVRHSVTMLRVALGFVFILFGSLKFFPGLSPAQELATETMGKLTFGLIPAGPALLAVAVAEVGVGICLIANRFMRVAIWFLAFEMFAILSPLVLLHGELFSGQHGLPNLVGQYILKDFVLLAGVMVLFATQRGARITPMAGSVEDVPATRTATATRTQAAPTRTTPSLAPSPRYRVTTPRRAGALATTSTPATHRMSRATR